MKAAPQLARRASLLAFALIGFLPIAAQAQVRNPTHVACVGDSITYGYLASSTSKSYPSDLQTIFGSSVMVKNFGRNSATLLSTGDLPYINQTEYTSATTFVSGAGANAVVDVIIMLGTNDSKSYNWTTTGGTRAAQFMTDYAALVDHFTGLSTHPRVYLAIPAAIYTNTFGISESVTANEIDPIIRQVATQKGMPIIDIHTPTSGHPEYFQDGVHPTDAGYMILAQLMHDGLLQPAGTGGAGGGGGGGAGGAGAGGRGGSGGAGGAGRGGSGGTSGGAGGGSAGRGGSGGAAGRGGAGGAAAGAGGGAGAAGVGGAGGAAAGTGGAAAGAAGTGGSTAGAAGASGGSIGGTGTTGAGGRGGSSAGGNGGNGGAGTAGAGTPGAAGSGGSGGDSGGGGGCSCRVVDAGSGFVPGGLLLMALALVRRRRR